MSQSGISKEFVDAIRSVDPAATMWLHPDVQLAICIRPLPEMKLAQSGGE